MTVTTQLSKGYQESFFAPVFLLHSAKNTDEQLVYSDPQDRQRFDSRLFSQSASMKPLHQGEAALIPDLELHVLFPVFSSHN